MLPGSLGLLLEDFLVDARDLSLCLQIYPADDISIFAALEVHSPFSMNSVWRVSGC